jgi:N-acetylglutamate synthase-like GNAT family acetyltransferase
MELSLVPLSKVHPAVDLKNQGQGVGAWLLKQALIKALQMADIAGIFAVIVDAIDEKARDFYLKYGFLPLQNEPLTLFLPMETIRRAMGQGIMEEEKKEDRRFRIR